MARQSGKAANQRASSLTNLMVGLAKFSFLVGLLYLAISWAVYHWIYYPGNLAAAPPLEDTGPILVDFSTRCEGKASGEPCFAIGLASAPAHVEDELDDSWLEFARATSAESCGSGVLGGSPPSALEGTGHCHVPSWHNQGVPHDRLRFWSEPEVELDLVAGAGTQLFRLGVDWGRLVPTEPENGTEAVLDRAALERYREILEMVRERGMDVMLTLWHHSAPKWAVPFESWKSAKMVGYFLEFTGLMQREFGPLVKHWVTFNEAHLYAGLTYCLGAWPPGRELTPLEMGLCLVPFRGDLFVAMAHIIKAHRQAYDLLHENDPSVSVGVAHFSPMVRPRSAFEVIPAALASYAVRYLFPDTIVDKLDFLGINYYGQEVAWMFSNNAWDEVQYSDAGRGVFPDGLFQTLVHFHRRYRARHPRLRLMVTENGIADATDVLRPAYIVEHLLAVHAAQQAGAPVDAYLHWTVSDNWEWADGYCPKFGLVAVDRADGLRRTPRPSYALFAEIARSGQITAAQRAQAWAEVQAAVARNATTLFCRHVNSWGAMYAGALDEPVPRPVVGRDWRLGQYEQHALDDPFSKVAKVALGYLRVAKRDLRAWIARQRAPASSAETERAEL